MDAIGLNPIKLDAIGLDPIRMNAIRLGVPGASLGSARPYIDPELLSHVKMAISTWGKSNDDPDRAVLKDLTPNGNDMRLLNFGFAGNSGYGLYGTDFNNWLINSSQHGVVKASGVFKVIDKLTNVWLIYNRKNIASNKFSIEVKGIADNGIIIYSYVDESGNSQYIRILNDGTYEMPASKEKEGDAGGRGFYVRDEDINLDWTGLTIEQLPDFEGWLCTDGVDDIIESVNPVSEMLEGSNEITVVSIIHQISQIPGGESNKGLNNQIVYYDSPTTRGYLRNHVKDIGKTGIYGYTFSGTAHSVINNILGDKTDYIAIKYREDVALNGLFSVCGYKDPNGVLRESSQIAYAGGFIANKVLTTDEINQIIAYFNLDRPGQIIKPQLYCNIKKQGITNDNHAEFNDQLIDFVGGRNIQLNNVAWEGESGINSYPVVFGANKTWAVLRYESDVVKYNLAPNKITIYKSNRNAALLYSYVYNAGITNKVTIPSFKMKVTGLKEGQAVDYRYISESERAKGSILSLTKDGIYDIPKSYPIEPNENTSDGTWVGILINSTDDNYNLTLEVLPTIENALCLDGISDFGKATGLPILKDYTVAALRKWLSPKADGGGLISKSKISNDGAFIIEQSVFNVTSGIHTYSFGLNNTGLSNPDLFNKSYVYQTKYSYNGNPIQAGTGVDGDSMWLGTLRDNDTRFAKLALRSLLLFSYTLSEFLLERQLKKYKAGTLYPDMVEFRPIVKSSIPYSSISYSVNPGEYIAEGSTVTITITLSNETDKLVGVSSNAISDISISGDNGVYEITGKVTKSPQKISIVISSYLTMLGNDTLISNETLIKNK